MSNKVINNVVVTALMLIYGLGIWLQLSVAASIAEHFSAATQHEIELQQQPYSISHILYVDAVVPYGHTALLKSGFYPYRLLLSQLTNDGSGYCHPVAAQVFEVYLFIYHRYASLLYPFHVFW